MNKSDQNIIVTPSLMMAFNPESWNARDKVEQANCYAYALNAPALGIRDPGKSKDIGRKILNDPYNMVDVGYLRQLMLDDGLVPTAERDFNPAKNHIIALFGSVSYNSFLMEEIGNYHFMRLDYDDVWSEKPGRTAVQNQDAGGQLLKTSSLHDHFIACAKSIPDQTMIQSVFAGYYRVPESGLSFKPYNALSRTL